MEGRWVIRPAFGEFHYSKRARNLTFSQRLFTCKIPLRLGEG
jgi:hypothetical protein